MNRGVTHLEFLTAGIDKDDGLNELFREAEQIYGSRIIIERLNEKCCGDARVHEYTTELDAVALRMLRRQIAQVRAARAEESGTT